VKLYICSLTLGYYLMLLQLADQKYCVTLHFVTMDLAVLYFWLDSILKIFSNLSDSKTL